MNNNNRGSSGLGLSTVLTLIFLVLKLVGVIDWSWWLVFLPTIISVGLWLILIVVFFVWEVHFNKKYGLYPKKGKKDKWKF